MNSVENRFSLIGPIYYEHGSIVIIYEDASKAVRALYTLRESKYEDKQLLGIYLNNFFYASEREERDTLEYLSNSDFFLFLLFSDAITEYRAKYDSSER